MALFMVFDYYGNYLTYPIFGWALVVGSVVFGYNLFVVIYNLVWHSLKKFPGPPLARCTGLWGFYWNLYSLRAHKIDDAHKRYGHSKSQPEERPAKVQFILPGNIIRIAPNLLPFSDPETVLGIYNSKNFVKAESFYVGARIPHLVDILTSS
jgi:hypothetical protein